MTQLLENIFAEKLNAKDNRWKIVHGKLYIYQREQLSDINVREIELLPGSYEILFTTKDCTEDDASSVRNAVVDAHFDTELQEWRYGFHYNNTMIYENATAALKSLLRSHGLDVNKNYLLLKKIS